MSGALRDGSGLVIAVCVLGIAFTLWLCRRAARLLADEDLPYLNPRRRGF